MNGSDNTEPKVTLSACTRSRAVNKAGILLSNRNTILFIHPVSNVAAPTECWEKTLSFM